MKEKEKVREENLKAIQEQCAELESRYRDCFRPLLTLSRAKAAVQGNRTCALDRWYRYKEAFSASLVGQMIRICGLTGGKMLDPFAGSGTALFTASRYGMDAEGIELLPIGQEIIRARMKLEREFTEKDQRELSGIGEQQLWKTFPRRHPVPELRITRGAYPVETVEDMERYLAMCQESREPLQTALRLALLCVLETISFTRKDGQCLRWDHRSGRKTRGRKFHKGKLMSFDQAIRWKIREMCSDLHYCRATSGGKLLFEEPSKPGHITLHSGSCLDIMPELKKEQYTAIITSPPYCNRYDYTRIYALELALLGVDEVRLKQLRQEMLSCTVEHRTKELQGRYSQWDEALAIVEKHELLQSILNYLEWQRQESRLNNQGIPRMIRGYFQEMAIVIAESARTLVKGGYLVMVNDNVRYAGVSIPVDTILSSLAELLGFDVRHILVLPESKGNSSQQMGTYGKIPLRKCIYVWQK